MPSIDNNSVPNTDSDSLPALELSQSLGYSRQANFNWICTHPDFDNAINLLLEELLDWYVSSGHSSRSFRRADNLNMLKRIVSDLYVCYLLDPSRWISISFSNSYYSIDTRYQPKFGSAGSARRVRDFLVERRYMTVHSGFYNHENGTGRLTRIKSTEQLAILLEAFSLADFFKSPESETVLLKDTSKRLIDYADNETTRSIRDDLATINAHLRNAWIDIHVSDAVFVDWISEQRAPDFSRKSLTRIFNNGSFAEGGRFYHGWWQEIDSNYRSSITINGAPTVELDYSAMNAALLYAEAGLSLPTQDPYSIDQFSRAVVKQAFITMLNTGSRAACISSVFDRYRDSLSRQQVIELLEQIESSHTPVSDYFYTNIGLRLQNTDSNIANRVMLNLSSAGVIALPVHDSFIVERQYTDLLRSTMIECFALEVSGSVQVTEEQADTILVPDLVLTSVEDSLAAFETSISQYSMYMHRRAQHETY